MNATPPTIDHAGHRIGLVCSHFNEVIVERLERGARDALIRRGVAPDDITTIWVPGAWEIPQVAKALAVSGRVDAIVGLGAVIRGETFHFEVIATQSAAGLARIALDTGVVVTNGILTTENLDQALNRAGGKSGNKGAEAALSALETLEAVEDLKRVDPR